MTVKESPLSGVMDAIRNGAANLRKKNDQGQAVDIDREVDFGDANLGEGAPSPEHQQNRREPRATINDGDDIVEAEYTEALPPKRLSIGERFNALGKGKKALVVVLMVAGAVAMKNQVDAPSTESNRHSSVTAQPGNETSSTQVSSAQAEQGNTHEALELPQTELGKLSTAATTTTPANAGVSSAIGFDTNEGLELGTPSSTDSAGAGQDATDSQSFSLNGPFGDGLLKTDNQQALDAQTQSAKQIQPVPNVQPILTAGQPTQQGLEHNSTSVLQQPTPTVTAQNGKAAALQATPANVNPFEKAANDSTAEHAGNDTRFGGSDSPKLDSGKPVLGKADASANVATLKAEMDAQDRKLTEVDGRLKQAEAKLAGVPLVSSAKAHSRPVTTPARHVATAHKTSAPTKVAKASPVKVLPRPKLCVAAVAEPARNCSTCVAHAFVTSRGQETMVGQGDYIEGYRVSIQGDRLDLQDDKGVVAHKFWSSPDGCKSI
ncbi:MULTISPECIES: hypothetical protein [Pseudomonas]|uniref:Uncharacterized protein n=1 Tax=Pseudomonas fluorescens TaxID=294 RepID=A0A166QNX6_PSEFL|nr:MULTISPECIES: hypothetical protein [Pseudomonas]KZN20611.1 hypothetical protein A1D17_03470 [Pseudomonas fluorescens]